MSTALFGFDRPEQAQRAADGLRQSGVAAHAVTLHLPKMSSSERAAAAIDEQTTGGLLTNVSGLFGEVFEWGSLPLDTSAFAARVRRGGAVIEAKASSSEERQRIDSLMSRTEVGESSGWIDSAEEVAAREAGDRPN